MLSLDALFPLMTRYLFMEVSLSFLEFRAIIIQPMWRPELMI